MLTPGGVKHLTAARIAYRQPSRASQALATAQMSKAAQSAGVPLELIPAFGEGGTTALPGQTGRQP